MRPPAVSAPFPLALGSVARPFEYDEGLAETDPCRPARLLPLLAAAEIAAPFSTTPVRSIVVPGLGSSLLMPTLEGVPAVVPGFGDCLLVRLLRTLAAAELAERFSTPVRFLILAGLEASPTVPTLETSADRFVAFARLRRGVVVAAGNRDADLAECRRGEILDGTGQRAGRGESGAAGKPRGDQCGGDPRARECKGLETRLGRRRLDDDELTTAAIIATISSSLAISSSAGSADASSRSLVTSA